MNRRTPNDRHFFRINKKGITLLPLILIITIMGGLITAGITLVASITKKAKISDTQAAIDAAMKAVVSWSVANDRIPDTLTGSTGFGTVTGNTSDAWGRGLVYIAADNMINPSPARICSRTTTNLGLSTGAGNIAFVVLSAGEDYTTNTVPGTSQAYSGTVAVSQNDIVRWMTLEELKNRAGCYGTTQGRLKIMNNELPVACIGQAYNAILYSDGGVSPYSGWIASPLPLPGGLSLNTATGAISSSSVTGPAQAPSVTFTRSDSEGNTVQKILKLEIKNCAASGSSETWSFDDPANPGGATSGTGTVNSITGIYGSALLFQGVATLVPYNQGVNNSKFSFERTQPFSIVLWVRLTKLPTTAPASLVYPLVSKAGPAPDYTGYYLELYSSANRPPTYNRIIFRLVGSESAASPSMIYLYNTARIDTLDLWYHVAATYNGNGLASGVRLYVNGASTTVTSSNNLDRSIVNTAPLRFGDYGKNYYNSVIMDEIQVYNNIVWQLKVGLNSRRRGSGTVVSVLVPGSPERINCGGACEAYFVPGTSVTLTAAPDAVSTFTGWSGGGCSGTGNCTVTLNNDTDVTATFSR